ncbi:hypothetical protein JI735_28450 [Paenibacillus sonchi]|uniref:Major facilitator superfamily (MFS) profile domain-containing protein n=1 Tax=Paenibacillus sonchi TaxID=373687 RepID=A0A974PAR4_9BACL|nr:hypothetical protein [Paenibacillus sonchi]QQZ60395.1 hypothetical protein JI735_28450 [Paenibacillus sonchi]
MNNPINAAATNRNYPLMTIILCWTGLVVMSSLYVTIPLITLFAQLFEVSTTNAAASSACLRGGDVSSGKRVTTIGFISTGFLIAGIVGQVGGKMRGIAVSVYTFILFTGTSFGPIISLQLMNHASFLITFLLLACILSIGLLAACLIHHEEAGE